VRYITIISTLALLFICFSVQPTPAETRYVGDQLVITLRAGKSSQHKIIKTLKTGTPLEVLDEGETYLKVRTEDGTVGYVLRQYVSADLPMAQRVAELKKQNNLLQQKINDLQTAKNNLETEFKTYQKDYQQKFSSTTAKASDLENNLEQALSNERLMSEKYNTLLAQSENVVEITAERDRLALQNSKLQAEVKDLTEKNDALGNNRMIKWFLAGGGVLFFGWIIGKSSRKKRSRL
jgi:SH3 domain protein